MSAETDFDHYFNATRRLQAEVGLLRTVITEALDALEGVAGFSVNDSAAIYAARRALSRDLIAED